MNTKTVSQLDAAGYFVGATIAQESPLEPGVFLIPGGAIDRAPPTEEPGKRYKPNGNGWQAEAIPAPIAEPAPPAPTPQDIRRGEITASLYGIDQATIRPARAIAAALAAGQPAPAFESRKLADLETQAAALRAELAAM